MDLTSRQQRLRESVWLVCAEFAIVAALFVADIHRHIFFSKTLYLFLLGWASLRLRGLRWKDVGFSRPRCWRNAFLIGIAAGIAMEAFELFVSQPLLARWFAKMPDLSDLGELRGHLGTALLFLGLSWTLAAFGEELVYRGYLMNRFAGVLRNTSAAWIASLIVISLVFGFGHIDQGITGQLENVWDGLLLGVLYLASGRNLTAVIIAHGVTDSLDILLMYLGRYPGIK